jgi:hypothetical protein
MRRTHHTCLGRRAPPQPAHPTRAVDQVAGRRALRKVVHDGPALELIQELASRTQILWQFGNRQQHGQL